VSWTGYAEAYAKMVEEQERARERNQLAVASKMKAREGAYSNALASAKAKAEEDERRAVAAQRAAEEEQKRVEAAKEAARSRAVAETQSALQHQVAYREELRAQEKQRGRQYALDSKAEAERLAMEEESKRRAHEESKIAYRRELQEQMEAQRRNRGSYQMSDAERALNASYLSAYAARQPLEVPMPVQGGIMAEQALHRHPQPSGTPRSGRMVSAGRYIAGS